MKGLLFLTSIALLLGCSPTRNKTTPTTPERPDWRLWAASWHPDKPQIVVGGTQDTLRLFSTKDLIVAVGENIALFDLKTGALTEIADRKDNVLMLCVAWHPSGDFFVTGDYGEPENGFPTLLQFWTQAGKNMKSIEKSKAEYRNLNWSDDGELLATASESIRLWNKNGDLVAEKSAKNLLWGIDWNKEGTQLISTDEKGRIQVWDKKLNTLKEIKY